MNVSAPVFRLFYSSRQRPQHAPHAQQHGRKSDASKPEAPICPPSPTASTELVRKRPLLGDEGPACAVRAHSATLLHGAAHRLPALTPATLSSSLLVAARVAVRRTDGKGNSEVLEVTLRCWRSDFLGGQRSGFLTRETVIPVGAFLLGWTRVSMGCVGGKGVGRRGWNVRRLCQCSLPRRREGPGRGRRSRRRAGRARWGPDGREVSGFPSTGRFQVRRKESCLQSGSRAETAALQTLFLESFGDRAAIRPFRMG